MTFAIEKFEWNGLPPCRPFQISKGRTSGRTRLTQTNIMLSLIDNNGQDQFFFTDLEALMKMYLTEGSESYTAKHLKLKLIDHYRDRLMILSQDGWMGVGVGWGMGCGWGWGVLCGWGVGVGYYWHHRLCSWWNSCWNTAGSYTEPDLPWWTNTGKSDVSVVILLFMHVTCVMQGPTEMAETLIYEFSTRPCHLW